MSRAKARKRIDNSTSRSPELERRIQQALAGEQFQSARELAKTLFKQDPTAPHAHLFNLATVGRSRQLRAAGRVEDATTILRAIADNHFDSQELLGDYLGELLLVGDWRTVAPLAGRVTDPAVAQRVALVRFDAAVLYGPPGVQTLSPALQGAAEQVRTALQQWSQGNDAAVRESLAALPAEPTVLDWRRLIEGLLAYYGEGDALSGWRSLAPGRVPAAIAAPFRAQLDAPFRAAAPADLGSAWDTFGRTLVTESWLGALKDTQRLLGDHQVGAALRRSGDVCRALPAHSPLRERLRRVLYWAVVHHGVPEDRTTFRRNLGAPRDDPDLIRMGALALQYVHADLDHVQAAWRDYEQRMEADQWDRPDDLPMARALVWYHMGQLTESADECPTDWDEDADFAAFVDDDDEHDPVGADDELGDAIAAEECYRRSIELAPQLVAAHDRRIALLDELGGATELESAARQALDRFAEHPGALGALADLALQRGQFEEAVELVSRAIRARPHDAKVHEKADRCHAALLRRLTEEKRFDRARQVAASFVNQSPDAAVRSYRQVHVALVEFSAGEPARGHEWLAVAGTLAARPAVLLHLLASCEGYAVDARDVHQFDREFARALRGRAEVTTVLELLGLLVSFADRQVRYSSMHVHEGLILRYARRGLKLEFTESQWLAACEHLSRFAGEKLWNDFARQAAKRFPQNPRFPLHQAKYHLSLSLGEPSCKWRPVFKHLGHARRLALAAPNESALLAEIDRLFETAALNTCSGGPGVLGGGAGALARLAGLLARGLGIGAPDWDDADSDDEPAPTRPRKPRQPGAASNPDRGRQGGLW